MRSDTLIVIDSILVLKFKKAVLYSRRITSILKSFHLEGIKLYDVDYPLRTYIVCFVTLVQ